MEVVDKEITADKSSKVNVENDKECNEESSKNDAEAISIDGPAVHSSSA